METTPVHTLNLSGVLSESKRIIIASYSHFVALSLPFLPLCFSLLTSPLRLPDQLFTGDHFHKFPPNHQQLLISYLLYSLIVYLLALCAIATVTYSAYHAFFGEPVKFFAALKSLTFSFFPLVSTAIVAHALIFFISLGFLLFVGIVLMLVQNLGFVIDYNSIYVRLFSAIVGVILLVINIYFYVNWSLAFVVVVAESKWGFEPLMRSSYLVKGMRSVSLLVMSYFGVFGALMVWVYSANLHVYNYNSWAFVLITMLGTFFLMMFLLRLTAANTVLYNYCKALHGELAIEGFAHDYTNLPSDDEKVPHVVTVVAA